MVIRKATTTDSPIIANYLLLAMEDIVYRFIGEEDHKKARAFLLYFVEKENNQYSYQNCFVAEQADEILGAVNVYDGARLDALRKPVIEYIKTQFSHDVTIVDETQLGEYYIDSIGVNPNQRGKDIGSKLLGYLIDEYVVKNKQTLGLLVDQDNPSAKKLYLKLGFKPCSKKVVVGKRFDHLQLKG
jgi:ribosomal protein S18 acetylase RimI-like enzyme